MSAARDTLRQKKRTQVEKGHGVLKTFSVLPEEPNYAANFNECMKIKYENEPDAKTQSLTLKYRLALRLFCIRKIGGQCEQNSKLTYCGGYTDVACGGDICRRRAMDMHCNALDGSCGLRGSGARLQKQIVLFYT